MAEGVDYAGDRPTAAQLFAAGKRFVVRYGGPGGSWKHLDAGEARALIDAGLSLVANAEGAADGLLGGRSVGVSWARDADAHFRALGMPGSRPIYLSVDFDVSAAQWPRVAEAMRGAASVIGLGRVGVYGPHDAMVWARRDGVARWFWQTYAWSGGRWAPGNHIEQYRNGVTLAGGTVDLCRSWTADFGQWGQPEEDDVSAQDVWNHKIASPALDPDGRTAADWLKSGESALREVKATRTELGALAPVVTSLGPVLDALQGNLEVLHEAATQLAEDVAELKARPPAGTVTVSDEQLARVLEPVLRKVLGSVDEATP